MTSLVIVIVLVVVPSPSKHRIVILKTGMVLPNHKIDELGQDDLGHVRSELKSARSTRSVLPCWTSLVGTPLESLCGG